jgi:uncharacterized membrane protein
MKPKEFMERLNDDRIVAAIAEAERKTSGEIRVYVSRRNREDALAAVRTRFVKLGMSQTRQRNGVLIYFAPVTHKFAIWGDVGMHKECGESFWQELAAQMTPLLKDGQFTEAVVQAIRRVGEVLARHFPREAGDKNELPDGVARD